MNERIKELAEQAWDYAEQNNPEPYRDINDLCLEKFAELIVRECANVALWEQGKGYDVGEIILKHFGVEE